VPERLTLIVLLDALGHRQASSPSFLPWCEAPRAPVRTVLGYSSAAIPTLLSGRWPEEHGHFAMYRRAVGDDRAFRGLAGPAALGARLTGREWRFRRWIGSRLRARGITGYFALYDVPLEWLSEFDLCQRRDLFSPGAFEPAVGLADEITRAGGRIWNWGVPEDRAFRECGEEIDRGERSVLLLYTARLDALMHAEGPESPSTGLLLAEYDRRLSELRARASKKYTDFRIFVFGDHGMAAVRSTVDLWSRLRALPLRFKRDYRYFLDSTMARFWFENQRARDLVLTLLADTPQGRVLDETELRALGCWFPEADYGETIFLLQEGAILLPSFMSGSPVRGMHGYHPDDAESSTTLVTNVVSGDGPADLRGIHALVSADLGRGLPDSRP